MADNIFGQWLNWNPTSSLGAPAPSTPQAATQLAFQAAQAGFYQAAIDQLGVLPLPAMPPPDAYPVIVDWLDASPIPTRGQPHFPLAGIDQLMVPRGRPKPFSWWMHRPQMPGIERPPSVPQPTPFWLQSRPYSRGAGAYSPSFGVIPSNPIGSGVYAPHRLPTIAGPGATYNFGAIWFDVQVIPTSIEINPTIPIETMDALIASSSVAGTYLTTG